MTGSAVFTSHAYQCILHNYLLPRGELDGEIDTIVTYVHKYEAVVSTHLA